MPINSSLTPSAMTTFWAPHTPIGSPAATSIRAHSCGLATAPCWPPHIKSSTSRAELAECPGGYSSPVKCQAWAMTERASDVIADDDATALLAIESIKQLKARYCRYLDTKDWAAWRAIFTA